LVTKWALPAGAVVVALALGDEVDGAAAVGGVVGLVVDGAGVVCASALVNAKPLTAATAMILLSICASCGRSCEEGLTGGKPVSCRENAGTAPVFPVPDAFMP
jgi:hypothetical protein